MDILKYYHSKDEVFIFGKMERMALLINELMEERIGLKTENEMLKVKIEVLEEKKDGAESG